MNLPSAAPTMTSAGEIHTWSTISLMSTTTSGVGTGAGEEEGRLEPTHLRGWWCPLGERNQCFRVEDETGLLDSLADGSGHDIGVLHVHAPTGEHRVPTERAALGGALEQQHLQPVVTVTDHHNRRSRDQYGYR